MSPAAIYTAVRDLLILAVIGFIAFRVYTDGKNAAKVADMAAVQKQLAANAAQSAAWQKESSDANLKRQSELAQVSSAIGAQRAPVLVCPGPSSPGPLPSHPTGAGGEPAAPRSADAGPRAGAAAIDIRPAINAFELKYERAFADCRSVLNQWPKEAP